MSHQSRETLEAWAMGALDDAAARDVEAHVAGCAPCQAALQREARLELGLSEVARAPVPLLRRRAVRVASALAAAAMLLVVAGTVLAPTRHAAPEVQRCDAADAPRDCVARAQYDGMLSIGPGHEVLVPRYDEGGTP